MLACNDKMNSNERIDKVELNQIPRIQDRMTFIYLERCKINRDDSAIKVTDADGITFIPAASLSILLLGPGTDVTHRAMELLGDMGITTLWVGEHGVRFYACGKALTHRSTLLIKQAELVSNEKKHIAVARKMYQLRFQNEDVSKLTMQQLRGREGSRIRSLYKTFSKKYGVPWTGRSYKTDDYEDSDEVNKSLSAGNACLYGLAHAVICALGCSSGLGFVHVGHELSFVYDIADLYKAETTIPVAFEIASKNVEDIGSETRRALREIFRKGQILDRMVHDIKYLLLEDDFKQADYTDTVYLWDNKDGNQPQSTSYGKEEK